MLAGITGSPEFFRWGALLHFVLLTNDQMIPLHGWDEDKDVNLRN